MISISVFAIICWAIVGILNVVNYVNNRECRWIDYWILYGVFIINLINKSRFTSSRLST